MKSCSPSGLRDSFPSLLSGPSTWHRWKIFLMTHPTADLSGSWNFQPLKTIVGFPLVNGEAHGAVSETAKNWQGNDDGLVLPSQIVEENWTVILQNLPQEHPEPSRWEEISHQWCQQKVATAGCPGSVCCRCCDVEIDIQVCREKKWRLCLWARWWSIESLGLCRTWKLQKIREQIAFGCGVIFHHDF